MSRCSKRRRTRLFLQHLRARMESAIPSPESRIPHPAVPHPASRPDPASLRVHRRSDRADRPPARRAGDAGGDRRAQLARLRPPQRAVADRESGPAGGRVVRTIGSEQQPISNAPSPESPASPADPESRVRPVPSTSAKPPLAPDVAARAADGRLLRHQPDDRSASDGAAPRRAGAARRAARRRSAARPERPPRARGRRGHHAAAAGHRQGVRLPHARR